MLLSVCQEMDGGDELFYGYSRYFQAYSWWSKLSLVQDFLDS